MRERHPAARQAGLGAEDAAATSSRGSNSVDAAGGDGGSAPPPRRPRVSPLCLGVLVVLCSAVSVGMALWGYHALLRVTTPRVQDARRVPVGRFVGIQPDTSGLAPAFSCLCSLQCLLFILTAVSSASCGSSRLGFVLNSSRRAGCGLQHHLPCLPLAAVIG